MFQFFLFFFTHTGCEYTRKIISQKKINIYMPSTDDQSPSALSPHQRSLEADVGIELLQFTPIAMQFCFQNDDDDSNNHDASACRAAGHAVHDFINTRLIDMQIKELLGAGGSDRLSDAFDPLGIIKNQISKLKPILQRVFPRGPAGFPSDDDLLSALQLLLSFGSMSVEDLPTTSRHAFITRSAYKRQLQKPLQGQIITSKLDRKPRRPLSTVTPERPRTQISANSLHLFTWHAGHFIDGTLSSFADVSGPGNIVVILREEWSRQLLAVFVTCKFPEDLHSRVGCRVRVHDPYYRIGTGGRPSLRVDCAEDIIFFAPSSQAPSQSSSSKNSQIQSQKVSVEMRKNEGDTALRDDDPVTALQHYWEAIRDPSAGHIIEEVSEITIATACFGNLALCFLKLERLTEALYASSFALLLNPHHVKASAWYSRALSAFRSSNRSGRGSEGKAENKAETEEREKELSPPLVFRGEMPHFHFFGGDDQGQAKVSLDSRPSQMHVELAPAEMKARGNAAFGEQAFSEAIEWYGRALSHPSITNLGNLFSNMANAYMQLRNWHMVLITAPLAAVLKESLRRKNTLRYAVGLQHLGFWGACNALTTASAKGKENDYFDEYFKALLNDIREQQAGRYDFEQILTEGKATTKTMKKRTNNNPKPSPSSSACSAAAAASTASSTTSSSSSTYISSPVSDYVGAVCVEYINDIKGRGLVATAEFKRGDLIMGCRALISTISSSANGSVNKTVQGNGDSDAGMMLRYGSTIMSQSSAALLDELKAIAAVPGSGQLLRNIYALSSDDEPKSKLQHTDDDDELLFPCPEKQQQAKSASAVPSASGPACDSPSADSSLLSQFQEHGRRSWQAAPFREPYPHHKLDLGHACEAIFHNSFGLDFAEHHQQNKKNDAGLFLWPSLMNHADQPNTNDSALFR